MANLAELSQWVDGIHQLETTDEVIGGPDGMANLQAKQLANRTQFLKALILAAQNSLAGHEDAADPHPQYLTTAEGNSLIEAAVAALVGQSPATLDTLNELAAALGNDPNFAASMATALGNKQPIDQTLTALAALATAANKLIYATGSDTFSTTDFTAFARTLLDDSDAAEMRATLLINSGFAISLSQNGYIKFPGWLGGLIIQWGVSGSTTNTIAVTFPIAFPNAVLRTLTHDYGSGASSSLSVWQVNSLSTTGFTARNIATINQGSSSVGASTSAGCPWFSIGW